MRINWAYGGMLPLTLLGCALVAAGMVRFFPGYLTNVEVLGGIIVLELLAATIWNFRQRFLTVLLVVFLLGGSHVPLAQLWSPARWLVLTAGAVAGLALYLRDQIHWFGIFHIVALFCILSSLASAVASSYPSVAALKALSLLLLFVYGMSGARLALAGREEKLLSGLLLGCEALIYSAGICYFILHYPLLGNPNSLGAIMGVVAVPLMLWGMLVAKTAWLRRRRQFASALAVFLLLSSYARAGIVAAVAGTFFICLGWREYKLMFKGAAFLLIAGILVARVVPAKINTTDENASPIAKFIYKSHGNNDALESRRPVWEKTLTSIHDHPFFGTGFGTSDAQQRVSLRHLSNVSSDVGVREHGNSYLAIVEWEGILGVIPFAILIILIVISVGRCFKLMRGRMDRFSPAIPMAAILAAGLVHACFEDWLFAVGYYLCVLFWTLAFMFVDVLPRRSRDSSAINYAPLKWEKFDLVRAGR